MDADGLNGMTDEQAKSTLLALTEHDWHDTETLTRALVVFAHAVKPEAREATLEKLAGGEARLIIGAGGELYFAPFDAPSIALSGAVRR